MHSLTPGPSPQVEKGEELEATEAKARELVQWLTDHPHATIDQVREQRRRLMEALQQINDLVMRIKAPMPYKI